ncbi:MULTISPECIES: hypothetical protein [unclassified Variovorax]|uniref:hypothetical protein n=1 Tax=unclassified Variovorax TaxID=663243 RepID=UPI003F46EF15
MEDVKTPGQVSFHASAVAPPPVKTVLQVKRDMPKVSNGMKAPTRNGIKVQSGDVDQPLEPRGRPL